MARARKCDRCGALYEPESMHIKSNKVNGLLLIDRDMDNKYMGREYVDLCPKCLVSFLNWWK